MFWGEIWDFIKRNIFGIVLIITLLVAVPWSLIFVLPVAIFFLLLLVVVWRVRRQQRKIYEEVRRQAGERYEQQQSQRSWWHRANKSDGEVTVVQTEQPEQRVSDDVGEYVDFKEIKEDKIK